MNNSRILRIKMRSFQAIFFAWICSYNTSSHWQMCFKKDILKDLAIFTEKHLCLIKLYVWIIATLLMKGFSVRTNDDLNETLSAMFPDSKIARNFSMARTKAMYAINHGIAPYFKSLLLSSINDTSDIHVYSFDKSLNEITETCKMDLYVRYWDVAYSQ